MSVTRDTAELQDKSVKSIDWWWTMLYDTHSAFPNIKNDRLARFWVVFYKLLKSFLHPYTQGLALAPIRIRRSSDQGENFMGCTMQKKQVYIYNNNTTAVLLV